MKTLLNSFGQQSVAAGAELAIVLNSQVLPVSQYQRIKVYNCGGALSGTTAENLTVLTAGIFLNLFQDAAMQNFVAQFFLAGGQPNGAVVGQTGYVLTATGSPSLLTFEPSELTLIVTPPPVFPIIAYFNFSIEGDVKNLNAVAQNCFSELAVLYDMM